MSELTNEARIKFKKSDSLKFLKELSQTMTKEEFLKFSNVSMLDAYRSNRIKAVEYMLSFYEPNMPELLMRIHLQKMLEDEKDFETGKKMLLMLSKHFSSDLCNEITSKFVEFRGHQDIHYQRKKIIFNLILEKKIPENHNVTPKRNKI